MTATDVPGGTDDRSALPIPDYDHLPIGSLGSRIRALDLGRLQTLLAYEQAHGNRLPAVQLMTARLAELEQEAQPSGGDPAAAQPESSSGATGSAVGPQTSGPTPDVQFQGVPGEPRRPHSGRSATSK
ncbi:hypothetical protein [Nakamurella endophytica]|nr:hypothetical protein [Nakamurella endophytica]